MLGKRAAKAAAPSGRLADTARHGHLRGGRQVRQDERHPPAGYQEQAVALERLLSRRLSVLVGRAGTGKTSVMEALMLADALTKDGILLLAPTGKARVRLGNATNAEAMTVAVPSPPYGRYDGSRQRPVRRQDKYRKEKTVVIDECSMLTMDDLVAVLEALDLAHVQRVILVGDPNQLPPIGVGRPFAELASHIETTDAKGDDGSPLGNASPGSPSRSVRRQLPPRRPRTPSGSRRGSRASSNPSTLTACLATSSWARSLTTSRSRFGRRLTSCARSSWWRSSGTSD